MTQKNTNTKTPKLRFPEFFDNWKDSTIEENCELKGRIGFRGYTKKDLVDKDDGVLVLGGKHIQGNVLNLSEPTYLSWDKYYESPEIMVKKHDIIFSQRGSLGDCALINSDIGEATINPSMVLIKKISCDYRFLFYILVGNSIQKQVKSISTSTAVPMLSQKQIKNFSFKLPELSEQQKIASFLSEVDKKLNLLQEKKDLLEDYKKGVMQQIFSQELRFKDENGNEYPEWEEKRISELFTITRGKVLSATKTIDLANEEYRFPVFSSQTKNNGLMGYYKDFLFENAITWTTDGANAGNVNYRRGKFYCTNVCGVLLSEKGYANQMIAELLNTITKKHVSYVGNPKLMNNVMANIKVVIPKSTEEQTQIANFLSALDKKIQLVAEALEATQQFKKGLLQQMFV